jgi:5-methylcytosine-specific restriction endonuclease McrA
MCASHYQRLKKYGDPEVSRKRPRSFCSINGCGKPVVGRGWCSAHWTRWQRYGDPAYRMPGEVVDGKKICPRCEVDKPRDEYGNASRLPLGWSRYCKLCTRAIAADWRASNPDYQEPPLPPGYHAERTRHWRQEHPDRARAQARASNQTRRARRVAAEVEKFTDVEIFDRDGWLCGICAEPIDRTLRYPDPMSVSLDHVMPLSRGGKHSRANTQAAHLICNVRKSDRVECVA